MFGNPWPQVAEISSFHPPPARAMPHGPKRNRGLPFGISMGISIWLFNMAMV